MAGWLRRLASEAGSWRQVVVVTAALVLAVGALGLLLWSVATPSAGRLAWLTSVSGVLAVVLAAWGMAAAMLAWAVRSARAGVPPGLLSGPEHKAAGLRGGAAGGLPVGVPFGRLPAVVRGRDGVISQLCASLGLRESQRLWPARRPAPGLVWVVAGMGGLGKSTVALAVARVALSAGWRVWWVTAADSVSLTGGMVEVLCQLGAPDTVTGPVREGAPFAADRAWDYLSSPLMAGRRWLLVFDNADDPSVLAVPGAADPADQAGWLRSGIRGAVIVTTRHVDSRAWGHGVRLCELPPLDEDASGQVLADLSAMAGDRDGLQARELGRRLGGLPLALYLAGSYLASPFARWRTFDEYRHALDSSELPAVLADLDDAAASARTDIQRTWDLSLDALAADGRPQARPLLFLLSCYAPGTRIPARMLRPQLLAGLLAGPGSQDTGGAGRRIRRGLRGLAEAGLIGCTASGGPDTGQAITVHPVVADANRALLRTTPTAGLRPVSAAAVQLLHACCDELDRERPADWPAWRRLAPHLLALLGWAADLLDDDILAGLLEVTSLTASTLVLTGAVGTAEQLARAGIAAGTRLGASHPAQLAVRLAAATAAAEQVCNAGTELLYRDLLADHEQALGRDHPATLAARYGHTRVLGFLSHPQAERIHRDMLADHERVLGLRDPATLTARHWLGRLLVRLGRPGEAEQIYRQVLHGRRDVLGAYHPDTLVTRHTLAWAIAQQGRYHEAEQQFTQVITDQQRVLGDSHPHVLGSGRALGWCITMQGRYSEAEQQLRQILAAQQQVRGDDHPATLQTRHILAWTIAAQDRPAEAEPLCRQTLDRRLARLGSSHPATHATRQLLATVITSQGRHTEAQQLLHHSPEDPAASNSGTALQPLKSINGLPNTSGDIGGHRAASASARWVDADRRIMSPGFLAPCDARFGHRT